MRIYPMMAKNIRKTPYKRYEITVITAKTPTGWKATVE